MNEITGIVGGPIIAIVRYILIFLRDVGVLFLRVIVEALPSAKHFFKI